MTVILRFVIKKAIRLLLVCDLNESKSGGWWVGMVQVTPNSTRGRNIPHIECLLISDRQITTTCHLHLALIYVAHCCGVSISR